MDFEDEEWVNIHYDGLLEVHDDGGKQIFSRKYVRSPKKLVQMNYFDSPRDSQKFVDSTVGEDSRLPNQVIPLPIQLDDYPIAAARRSSFDRHHEEGVKEVTKHPILIKEEPERAAVPEADQDPIFQVFFKKENEFVEMKMDSPRSSSRETPLPQIETGAFQYEANSEDHKFNCSSPTKVMVNEKEMVIKEEEVIAWGESNQGLNLWKWGFGGIGAIFSFGMAAATICIIIFGNGQKTKQQKIRFQIYSDDKRIKQVVAHANEAMSAMRGVPLNRAQITYGGYYEGV